MNRSFLILIALTLALPCTVLHGAYIGYLYPAGGQRGTRVEVIAGGQQLWGIVSAEISGGGVKVESVSSVPGFNFPYPVQRKYILAALKAAKAGRELPPKPEKTDDWRPHRYYDNIGTLTPKELDIAIEEFFAVRNSLQASPAISQKLLIVLNIAPDALPGKRELRLKGRNTLTNPLPFVISDTQEFLEARPEIRPKKRETVKISVPCAVNGQIMPGGERDIFPFTAKKGEVITFAVHAREFAPFLGDCVPGHFQPIAEVFDAKGKSLAFADYNHFNPDPVLVFRAPQDGEYVFTVRDAIWRGRADFVYRVDAFKGTRSPEFLPVPELPELVRISANDAKKKVMDKDVLISGTLEKAKEKHVFRFHAEKGVPRVLEVFARRLRSPLDASLIVRDGKGKIVAENDDPKYFRAGLIHHQADPHLCFTPGETGEYSVTIFDPAGKSGKDYFYHLRIDKPRPDFSVYITPSALHVPWSGAQNFTAEVVTKEGFCAPVELSIEGTKNIVFSGTNILPAPKKKDVDNFGAYRVPFSLSVKGYKGNEPVKFDLMAKSGNIRKKVIPADPAMQAFAYTHLIPAENLYAIKQGDNRFFWRGKLLKPARSVPVRKPKKKGEKVPTKWIPPEYETVRSLAVARGTQAELTVFVRPLAHDASYSFLMKNAPAGLSIVKTELIRTEKDRSELVRLTLNADKKTEPGSFNPEIFARLEYDSAPDRNGKIKRNTADNPLPVLTIEVK